MNEFEKAACIGMYRSGAKTETIMWVLNHPYVTIDKCITDYLNTLEQK